MTSEEYVQFRAFARLDGVFFALLLTASFACYIVGLSNPTLSLVAMGMVLSVPFFIAMRLKSFRDNGLGGHLSFLRGWAYVALLVFYGSLLFALVQYLYFAFLDHGYFMKMIQELMDSPDSQEVINQYATKEVFDQMISELSQVRPIDFSLSMLQANIFLGVLLGLPIAALMKSGRESKKDSY